MRREDVGCSQFCSGRERRVEFTSKVPTELAGCRACLLRNLQFGASVILLALSALQADSQDSRSDHQTAGNERSQRACIDAGEGDTPFCGSIAHAAESLVRHLNENSWKAASRGCIFPAVFPRAGYPLPTERQPGINTSLDAQEHFNRSPTASSRLIVGGGSNEVNTVLPLSLG
jgi:hypothetical protein